MPLEVEVIGRVALGDGGPFAGQKHPLDDVGAKTVHRNSCYCTTSQSSVFSRISLNEVP